MFKKTDILNLYVPAQCILPILPEFPLVLFYQLKLNYFDIFWKK